MSDVRIIGFIENFAKKTPDAPALLFPGRATISYAQLHEIILKTGLFLTQMGVGVNDRVGVVLPDGLEMACAIFSVSNVAVFVPLDPNYSRAEFKHYMALLKVNYLILGGDIWEHPSLQAAADLNIKVIRMSLPDIIQSSLQKTQFPTGKNHDTATITYTSGTTEEPKLIPKTHINHCVMAGYKVNAFRLTPDDRNLIITPLFRGISVSTLLTSVASGSSSICLGKFEPSVFMGVLETERPTWFTASPAVLQALADYAEKNNYVLRGSSLRFVRSSGATLSTKLSERLERIFGVPVVITYGLTEAGMVACNYLAPKGHKEGSVGVSSGCEIGILDEAGQLLPTGSTGEIALRGPNVMSGYLDNPQANEHVFINGWFRTGDQGRLDQDGYLFITGRIKELINRGGEKASPYEVEAAILQHPDVLETAVFAVPSARFGEDVAAMVVMRPGTDLSLMELRKFLKGKISHFKMPTRLFAVKEIPKGPAGKVQRKQLYKHIEQLGNDATVCQVPEEPADPKSETEEKLTKLWQELLKTDRVGVKDNFFELGGDSLLVAVLFAEIEKIWDRKVPLSVIFEHGTIEELAAYIEDGPPDSTGSKHPFLVPIQMSGIKPPIFCIHAKDGEVLSYWYLSRQLGYDQPVYGLRFNPQSLGDCHPLTTTGLAKRYVKDIRSVQPTGPYHLLGHSGGGVIALEIARQLEFDGQEIRLLAMLDSKTGHTRDTFTDALRRNQRELSTTRRQDLLPLLAQKVKAKFNKYKQAVQEVAYSIAPTTYKPFLARYIDNEVLIRCSSKTYKPQPYNGEVIFFLPEEHYQSSTASLQQWSQLLGGLKIIVTPGDHHNMILEPHVAALARELSKCI